MDQVGALLSTTVRYVQLLEPNGSSFCFGRFCKTPMEVKLPELVKLRRNTRMMPLDLLQRN